MGTHLSYKYSQNLFDAAKKSTADAIKTASKIPIQKTAEATGDLTGIKIADKMMTVSKKTQNNESKADSCSLKDVPKKRYISPEERQQIIDELRLV